MHSPVKCNGVELLVHIEAPRAFFAAGLLHQLAMHVLVVLEDLHFRTENLRQGRAKSNCCGRLMNLSPQSATCWEEVSISVACKLQ